MEAGGNCHKLWMTNAGGKKKEEEERGSGGQGDLTLQNKGGN
mgnify:CR=1 FL=1